MDEKDFAGIVAGLEEAVAIAKGEAEPATYRVHIPTTVDVKSIRMALGLSQVAFAAQFGFSAGAVRDWEQNRKRPEGAARVLLTVIAKEPDAVKRALEAA